MSCMPTLSPFDIFSYPGQGLSGYFLAVVYLPFPVTIIWRVKNLVKTEKTKTVNVDMPS
jgi:hypothetical protein